jgi:hypothetical protein
MLQIGDTVDRYVVEGLIGSGGLAQVYRVRHRQLGTVHALKVMAVGGRKLAARLVQEGQIQSRLSHPGLVRVSDVVEHDGRAALLMELVEGESLEARLVREGALPVGLAMDLFVQVTAAVAVAHQAEVLHRDLKPPNILLSGSPEAPIAKITDFGIARSLGGMAEGATRTGDLIGTPGYMAPEQVDDAHGVDGRADLFSLGAVLYAMLTGRSPFAGDTLGAVLGAAARGDFVPIVGLRPEVPASVAAIAERCLAPNPDDRFADAGALLQAARLARGQLAGPGQATAVPDLDSGLTFAGGLPAPKPAAPRRLGWLVAVAASAVLVAGVLLVAVALWSGPESAEKAVEGAGVDAAEAPPGPSTPAEVPSTLGEVPSNPAEVPSTPAEVPSTPAEVPSTLAKSTSTHTESTSTPAAGRSAPGEGAPAPSAAVPAAASGSPAPPEPIGAPVEDAVAVAEEAPPPPESAPPAPSLSGAWSGTVGGRPLSLQLSGSGSGLRGELELILGATRRTASLRGGQSGSGFELAEEGEGQVWLKGSLVDGVLQGTLTIGARGKAQAWSARPAG